MQRHAESSTSLKSRTTLIDILDSTIPSMICEPRVVFSDRQTGRSELTRIRKEVNNVVRGPHSGIDALSKTISNVQDIAAWGPKLEFAGPIGITRDIVGRLQKWSDRIDSL